MSKTTYIGDLHLGGLVLCPCLTTNSDLSPSGVWPGSTLRLQDAASSFSCRIATAKCPRNANSQAFFFDTYRVLRANRTCIGQFLASNRMLSAKISIVRIDFLARAVRFATLAPVEKASRPKERWIHESLARIPPFKFRARRQYRVGKECLREW